MRSTFRQILVLPVFPAPHPDPTTSGSDSFTIRYRILMLSNTNIIHFEMIARAIRSCGI